MVKFLPKLDLIERVPDDLCPLRVISCGDWPERLSVKPETDRSAQWCLEVRSRPLSGIDLQQLCHYTHTVYID